MFTDCAKNETNVDEKLFSTGVCIPCHAGMANEDVANVIKTVKEFFSS
jgi:dTDP-4-amino-4,6-dideoxygalactose transaminase